VRHILAEYVTRPEPGFGDSGKLASHVALSAGAEMKHGDSTGLQPFPALTKNRLIDFACALRTISRWCAVDLHAPLVSELARDGIRESWRAGAPGLLEALT
jgi:hypothetical protein